MSERKICKYIAYNDNFKHALFVQDIFPDENKFNKLKEGFKISEQLILEYKSKYEDFLEMKEIIAKMEN